jgi:hypothetical protein
MDKEYIKKLAENPNSIQGIYNYCDRLRRTTENLFHRARAFIRPGFDSEHNEPSPGSAE